MQDSKVKRISNKKNKTKRIITGAGKPSLNTGSFVYLCMCQGDIFVVNHGISHSIFQETYF